MIYQNFPLQSYAMPLTFFDRENTIEVEHKRLKSYSIKGLKPKSPNGNVINNPQDNKKRQGQDDNKSLKKALNVLTKAFKLPTQSVSNLRQNHNRSVLISTNLSVSNFRTTFSPQPMALRMSKPLRKNKEVINASNIKDQSFFHLKRNPKKLSRFEDKKCKQAPSFIKNKSHHNISFLQDFKIMKCMKNTEQYRQFVVKHKKTNAWFVIKAYKKVVLSKQKQLFQQIKFYIKNLEINHNLIVKCFGYFHDSDYFYIIEEYLQGQAMAQFTRYKAQGLNEQQVGSKICEILTAITYLNSIHFSYGNINQANIINSLNICKLKRPYLIYQKKDFLFDIWCLGKLAYELVTNCKLIEERMLEGCHSIQDLFQSNEIVAALEVGFKRLEGSSISRDLIKFLISTLWEIQNEQLTLSQVWLLQFIKLYKEEDIWPCSVQK